ncbi:energy transducer TonB [Saccharospirillum impatiens]|uniref:energy transducer TonB n=1 Tax=Saccharospirillum impatiens TaxID=169438 RepID=UPI00048FDA43|nr:energy transducer TonB [Saccharospirillum impatiens]
MLPIDAINQGHSAPVSTSPTWQAGLSVGVSVVAHLALVVAIAQAQNPKPIHLDRQLPQTTVALQLSQTWAEPAALPESQTPQRLIASTRASISQPEQEPIVGPEPGREHEPEPETIPEPAPEPLREPDPTPAPDPLPEQEPEPPVEPDPKPIQVAEQTAIERPENEELSNNTTAPNTTNVPGESSLAASHQATLREQLYNTYLAALMQELRNSFDYPRGALRRRQEGRVEVALRIETDGTIAGVTLDSSSGYTLLDESAIAMIERISGLPALPEAAGKEGLAVSVPIDFKLN